MAKETTQPKKKRAYRRTGKYAKKAKAAHVHAIDPVFLAGVRFGVALVSAEA